MKKQIKMKKPNKLFLVFFPLLILLSSCATPAPEKEIEETQAPAFAEITYCNIDDSTLCLEGFGKESGENLIILFKADNPDFENIYLRVNKNSRFQCAKSQEFPENIYCIGEIIPNGTEIEINVYTDTDNTQLASGKFTIQYGKLQLAEDTKFEETSTPQIPPPYPDYPNYPNHPNYPNYPNN